MYVYLSMYNWSSLRVVAHIVLKIQKLVSGHGLFSCECCVPPLAFLVHLARVQGLTFKMPLDLHKT